VVHTAAETVPNAEVGCARFAVLVSTGVSGLHIDLLCLVCVHVVHVAAEMVPIAKVGCVCCWMYV
jgi:hypothetical protein